MKILTCGGPHGNGAAHAGLHNADRRPTCTDTSARSRAQGWVPWGRRNHRLKLTETEPLTAGTLGPRALFPGGIIPQEASRTQVPPPRRAGIVLAGLQASTSVRLSVQFCNHWLKCQLQFPMSIQNTTRPMCRLGSLCRFPHTDIHTFHHQGQGRGVSPGWLHREGPALSPDDLQANVPARASDPRPQEGVSYTMGFLSLKHWTSRVVVWGWGEGRLQGAVPLAMTTLKWGSEGGGKPRCECRALLGSDSGKAFIFLSLKDFTYFLERGDGMETSV